MAWVDGKPKMVSERYLGSAADIAAALDARETAIRPERTRHLAFGDVAAAWGMLDAPRRGRDDRRGGRSAPPRRGRLGGHLPGAGRAGPAGRSLLQARIREMVAHHGRGQVHQDQCRGAGPPQVLGRDAHRQPRSAGPDRAPPGHGHGRHLRPCSPWEG